MSLHFGLNHTAMKVIRRLSIDFVACSATKPAGLHRKDLEPSAPPYVLATSPVHPTRAGNPWRGPCVQICPITARTGIATEQESRVSHGACVHLHMLIFVKPKRQSDTSSQWKSADVITPFLQISSVNTWVGLAQRAVAQAGRLRNLKNLAISIIIFQTSQTVRGIN